MSKTAGIGRGEKKARGGSKGRSIRKASDVAKRSLYVELDKALAAAVESGNSPWERSWNLLPPHLIVPNNPITGKPYKGVNALQLMCAGFHFGYADMRFATYKQAQERGWQVKGGETGHKITFFMPASERKEGPESDSEKTESTRGAEDSEDKEKKGHGMVIRSYTVFNASQMDGVPPDDRVEECLVPEDSMWHPCKLVERFVDALDLTVSSEPRNRNCYSAMTNDIRLSDRRQFESAEAYYAVLLHETAHWTGTPERNDRESFARYGESNAWRAKEEFVADIASLYFMFEFGLPPHLESTAAYLRSWRKALSQDEFEKEFAEAVGQANKAVRYAFLRAFERDPELEGLLREAKKQWFAPQREKEHEDGSVISIQTEQVSPSVLSRISDSEHPRLGLEPELDVGTKTESDGTIWAEVPYVALCILGLESKISSRSRTDGTVVHLYGGRPDEDEPNDMAVFAAACRKAGSSVVFEPAELRAAETPYDARAMLRNCTAEPGKAKALMDGIDCSVSFVRSLVTEGADPNEAMPWLVHKIRNDGARTRTGTSEDPVRLLGELCAAGLDPNRALGLPDGTETNLLRELVLAGDERAVRMALEWGADGSTKLKKQDGRTESVRGTAEGVDFPLERLELEISEANVSGMER